MANVVVTDSTSNTPNVGRVFDGIKFFVAQRVPSRTQYVKDIEANGGRVVKIEHQADYKIADHMRKDAPPGSYSFQLIDAALRNGQLPDPADHAIRPPGSVREAGSTVMGKGTRTAYTVEDDHFLWNWVKEAEARGESTGGNEIYKKIETANPRHTWQSWRDHFVKTLSKRRPTGVSVTVAATPPPSPPITAAEANTVPPANELDKFDEDDLQMLMVNARDIKKVSEDRWQDAWQAFAKGHPWHTADEWLFLYEHKVRPVYEALEAAGDVELSSDADESPQRSNEGESQIVGTKRKHESSQSPVYEPGSPVQDTPSKKQKTMTPEREGRSNQTAASRAASSSPNGANKLQLDPVVTSDFNTAASAQVEQEATINPRDLLPESQTNGTPSRMHTLRSEADLPTSDANKAAEAQIEKEIVAGDDGSHIDDGFEAAKALTSQLNEAISLHRTSFASPTQGFRQGRSPYFDGLVMGKIGDGYELSQQDVESDNAYEVGDSENDGSGVDFSLAEPDGGFDIPGYEIDDRQREVAPPEDGEQRSAVVISSTKSSSPYDGSPESSPHPRRAAYSRGTHAVETQDIVNAETQFPDMNVPLPFDSDQEPDEPNPKSSQALPEEEGDEGDGKTIEGAPLDTAEKVNSWISTMVVRGHKRAAAVKALKRTCMRPDLALLVLVEQRAGNTLPDDVPGIWSKLEDEILESGDGQGLEDLERKHGWEEIEMRMGFLADWRGFD